jgi:hypothetical protein
MRGEEGRLGEMEGTLTLICTDLVLCDDGWKVRKDEGDFNPNLQVFNAR